MSTTASVTRDPLAPARWVDVVLVLAAAPFVLLTGLPALGYCVGAAGWIATRLVGHLLERRAARSRDPRVQAGITIASAMGRAWVVALTILAVGLAGEREDGLTAALLVLFAFTVYLAVSVILRPSRRKPAQP